MISNRLHPASFSNVNAQLAHMAKYSNVYPKKINSGNATAMAFTTFKAGITAGTVNVTVIGDSISTESANTLTGTESYFAELKKYLAEKYPSTTFVFSNLAIAGSSIQEWNASKTINSVTKTWIEHVKDSAPDLLLIAFGMNNTQYSEAKQFKYNLKSMLEYIVANFTKQPSLAIVTTPKPTQNGAYSATESQNARDMAAFTARTYGMASNCYVVDVNRLFNIKRNGYDVKEFYVKEYAVDDSAITAIASGSYTKANGEYALQLTSHNLALTPNPLLKNFKIEFEIKFANIPLGDENISLYYNYASTINNVVIITPYKAAGVAYVRSYANNPDAAELTSSYTATYTASVSWNDDTYRKVLIQKMGDRFEVYVDGTLILSDKIQINSVAGYLKFVKTVGSVGTATMRNIKIYAVEERTYVASVTDEMMYGLYIDGNTGTKSPYGGNGINHPSSIGLEEVYFPPLKEFVADLPNS